MLAAALSLSVKNSHAITEAEAKKLIQDLKPKPKQPAVAQSPKEVLARELNRLQYHILSNRL